MDKVYLGRELENFLPGLEAKPITRVELLDEGGEIVGASGTEGEGRTLTALHPDGSDAMAASILAKVSGHVHRGYEGANALLDPAAELGDGITVNGYYVPLVEQDISFDALTTCAISAPDADELDEYPYSSGAQRKIERAIAQTRSLIRKTSEEIELRVEGVEGSYTSLKATLDGVTVTDSSGTTMIKGSSIETSTLKVKAANITGTLTVGQLPDEIVTEDNVTTITNDAIKTASISADQINAGTLEADLISVDGMLQFVTIQGSYTRNWGYIGSNFDKGGVCIASPKMTTFLIATDNAAKISYNDELSIWAASGGCYSSSAMQVYSDQRMKNSIRYDLAAEEALFRKLKPCAYRYNSEGEDAKTRWGFIAQDVIEGAKAAGMDAANLGAVGEYDGEYSLAYGEFTALNTHMIQALMARVDALERRANDDA